MRSRLLYLFITLIFISGSVYSQNPQFQWVHPKPFGSGIGWIKSFDANTVVMAGAGGTFFKSTDAGATFSINPFAGQASTTAATYDLYGAHFLDLNNGFATGIGGVMKTTDGGMTWSNASGSTFPVSAVGRKIYFRDANNGYVAGTSSIKLSTTTDGGATWVTNAALPATTYYDFEVFSPNRIIVAGSVNSTFNVRLTTDGGTTWQTAAAGTSTIYSLAFIDSLTGYAGSSSGKAFKTTDGGLTWTQLVTNNTTASFFDIITDGNDVYFVGDPLDLYKTTDGGATFSLLRFKPESLPRNFNIRAGAKSGNNIWIAGDVGYYFRSTDNGATWLSNTVLAKTSFLQGIYANADGKIIAVGSSESGGGNQSMMSTNYGASWTTSSLGVSTADLRGLFMFDSNTGFSCGSSGKIYKTTNGGASWDSMFTTNIQALNDLDFLNPQFGVVAGNGGNIWKTTDGGVSWSSISNQGSTVGLNAVNIISQDTIWVLGGGTSIYKTADGGATWTNVSYGGPSIPLSGIKFINSQTGFIWGGSGTSGQGVLFKTTDGGTTWSDLNFPYNTTMLYSFIPVSEADWILTGSYGNVFRTKDAGLTWKSYAFGFTISNAGQIIGSYIYGDTVIVTGVGSQIVKFTEPTVIPVELTSFTSSVGKAGVTLEWSVASELNNRGFEIERKAAGVNDWVNLGYVEGKGTTTSGSSYRYVDSDILPGRYNYRLKQIDFDGTTTVYELGTEVEFTVPVDFSLSQNYPNPFNPSTVIDFTIPEKSSVKLEVFSASGELVKTLVSGELQGGFHQVVFNASDLTSGLYIYRLSAQGISKNFTESRKMLLVK
ncbi:MAG: T9SS type A sorting domain-containing protein [Ignavibacteriaceae bacterium]|nr:T9SS type A sorting domain-containing protein [Ignavibacteriaceae bacterium]